MDCEQFQGVGGGVLEGESHPEAYAHLASCPRCRLLVDDLGSILRASRALPQYEPSERLWRRLEAAATAEGLWAQPAWGRWPGAAWEASPLRPAFAGLLGVTLLLAVGLVSYPTLELPVTQTVPATPFEVAQGELVQEASYATRYQMHLQDVEDRILAEAPPVDTEFHELVSRPLNVVDRAIEQTQWRLADYPDDLLAREELHRLYQQKVTVLQAITDPGWQEASR